MNTKKISVILIAVAFTLIVMFSCVAIFSVKEIEIEFAVADQTDITDVKDTLNSYLGKNMLFIKAGEIESSLKEHHYMKVISIEKQYPNVLKLKIEERKETYYVELDDKVYVTTAEGFVLNIIDKAEYLENTERNKITLQIKEIDISGNVAVEKDAELKGCEKGDTLAMAGDEFLSTVFELAKKVNLSDCIKELKIEKIVSGTAVGARDLVVKTHTGVTIRIMDADKRGVEKIEKAFDAYENATTDYVKTFNYILASVSQGEVVVEWSPTDSSPLGNE